MAETPVINIESIMSEIRAEIAEKGYTEDELSFTESRAFLTEENAYEDAINYLQMKNQIQWIYYYGGGLKGMLRRLRRRLIRFLIQPVIEDQNEYNKNVALTILELSETVKEQQRLIDELRLKYGEL